jgi:hypothetical protein
MANAGASVMLAAKAARNKAIALVSPVETRLLPVR